MSAVRRSSSTSARRAVAARRARVGLPEQAGDPTVAGGEYGSFPAACHYTDGDLRPEPESTRPAIPVRTGAAFTFWHPALVTLHVWLWYPNPAGLYASYNPLAKPFNGG